MDQTAHINKIDYKELREGNRVEAKSPEKSIWVKRAIVSHYTIEKLRKNNNRVHVKPIGPTEQILKELGFFKSALTWSKDISKFKSQYKMLVVDINGIMAIREGQKDKPRANDDLIVVHNSDIDGKLYLHKIQNFYYLLTGFELDFKK